MAYTAFHQFLKDAKAHHFAVGAFNVANMETVQAVTAAAAAAQVPVIAQVYHAHLDFAGPAYISAIGQVAAGQVPVPVCISLDHGQDFEQAKICIDNGFNGVMIDLATSDYQKNVEDTRRVVEAAHAKGCSVEAELGEIFPASMPAEVRNSAMTDPELAARFVRDTGVDALAVSVGTAHGFYSSKPQIDFKRLEQILEVVECPVVVHGGSNTPDEDIAEIVRMGVAKVNIGTDLMAAYQQALREQLQSGAFVDIADLMGAARARVQEVCAQKIALLTRYRR